MVDFYDRCQTQWIYSGMGGVRTGLRYEACEGLAKALMLDDVDQLFLGLQIIEREFLSVDHEKRLQAKSEKEK